jgi:hypothetical protein
MQEGIAKRTATRTGQGELIGLARDQLDPNPVMITGNLDRALNGAANGNRSRGGVSNPSADRTR